MSFALTLLYVALSLAGSFVDGQGTKGQVVMGFKYDVDVTPYLGLSRDCTDIKANAKAGKWPAANATYSLGKYFVRPSGTRSLKTIQSAVRTGEGFYDAYAKVYGAGYVETYMGSGSLTAAVGLERAEVGCQWIMLAFVGHELDVAKRVLATNASLARAEISDGFGIWYGTPGAQSLYRHVVQTQAWIPCGGSVVPRFVAAFINMKKAAILKNQGLFNLQYNLLFNKLVVGVYLRSITYAGAIKRNASNQKYAYGYLQTIRPLLAAKSAAAVNSLAGLLSGTALANPATVKALVRTLAVNQGISAKEAGIC